MLRLLPKEQNNGQAWEMEHFPARFQFVIFRNWNRITVERIADVLNTSADQVIFEAERLGLSPYNEKSCSLWLKYGYLTIIRENWLLLNYSQLLKLLGFTEEQLYRVLMEDDFMFFKMGAGKPFCPEVFWHELSPAELQETAEIRAVIAPLTAAHGKEYEFDFLETLKKAVPPAAQTAKNNHLRMAYCYCATFGDSLMPGAPDPFPEGVLAQYQAAGVNALWHPATLASLVPWTGDEDYSADYQLRQESLRQMCTKLASYGIKLFLYINEPRFFTPEIAKRHPEWTGPLNEDNSGTFAVCINHPEVAQRLEDGFADLLRAVPELGGFMTITMSENLTHCLSRYQKEGCPRCAALPDASANVIKVLECIANGIKKADSDADLIAWNWGWLPPWDLEVVKKMPPEAILMCVSETGVETDCYGIKGSIIDYSIAHPGPGKVARRLWDFAKANNRKCIAKVQLNATWELSSLPYIPVPQLAKKHIDNLTAEGIEDFVVSWTLGGFPGGNIKLLECSVARWCENISTEYAAQIEKACEYFSEGFSLFPFHETTLIYSGPQNFGCANLLYAEPSGRKSTMVGFPFDDMQAWCFNWHYPRKIMEQAFNEMCAKWQFGLEILEKIAPANSDNPAFQELYDMAEAGFCILRSSANQIAFYNQRDVGHDTEKMAELVCCEEQLARRMLKVQQRDSRIGFEASNHYMYGENTLLEKILNCRKVLKNGFSKIR